MLDEREIRAIAQEIVNEAKRKARVDQGTLKRSISYTVTQGVYIFREIFYGKYNGNSQLVEIVRKKFPNGVPYKIAYTDLNGREVEVSKTKQGRATQRSLLPTLLKIGTKAVQELRQRIQNRGKKKDKKN
jgi:hypothetical protein